ncbi:MULTISPECIES: type VI secretion system contractile sheath small subunit [Inhella]|uniref:Type VI secretion system contractile sheath small subunit n=1 Tax=Inhella proteolytica TaxID=2795029 RepID=A0A931J7W3_9BURK|nr:type VI secretion system contractile sheath small subunit [Inhella proteolytica]MBH9577740.1 type VI secretion system contractile sheath small subunit [Inhella proteolytica]
MSEGQKFIGRNRAPRVQIQYELEQYGAKKMVELPFIVGVMSDLAGKSDSEEAKKAVADRKFMEIDIDNFDKRMAAIKPKVSFQVDNALTGEGQIPVSIEFESMDDFSPIKVASKVDSLKKLVEARNQLAALKTYMDGKSQAEELLNKIIEDPNLLKAIADAPKPEDKAE